MDKCSF